MRIFYYKITSKFTKLKTPMLVVTFEQKNLSSFYSLFFLKSQIQIEPFSLVLFGVI